jgi:hypothetical protein
MSQASLTYNKALSFFYDGYYTKALKRFISVKNINEEYPQLNYYIKTATAKLTDGQDKESIRRKFVFRVIAIALIAGGIFIFYRWRRKDRLSLMN